MGRFPRLPARLDRIFPTFPLYFVTFCTYRRRPLLANPSLDFAFKKFLELAYTQHNIAVGRYVIMPDHIHFFVRGPIEFRLGRWVGTLKQSLGKAIPPQSTNPIWQRGFFDHLLRNDESYSQKWNYVRENPLRAGLVNDADDWPYVGEIILIDRA